MFAEPVGDIAEDNDQHRKRKVAEFWGETVYTIEERPAKDKVEMQCVQGIGHVPQESAGFLIVMWKSYPSTKVHQTRNHEDDAKELGQACT